MPIRNTVSEILPFSAKFLANSSRSSRLRGKFKLSLTAKSLSAQRTAQAYWLRLGCAVEFAANKKLPRIPRKRSLPFGWHRFEMQSFTSLRPHSLTRTFNCTQSQHGAIRCASHFSNAILKPPMNTDPCLSVFICGFAFGCGSTALEFVATKAATN